MEEKKPKRKYLTGQEIAQLFKELTGLDIKQKDSLKHNNKTNFSA